MLSHKSLAIPLDRLHTLAYRDTNTAAMILLGKVLESQKKDEEALALFRAAASQDDSAVGRDLTVLGDALVAQGHSMLFGQRAQRNPNLAATVLTRAAFECDNPLAFYYLAGLQEPMSETQETYLLKSASSGIAEAMHAIGILYRDRAASMAAAEGTLSKDTGSKAKAALQQEKETYNFAIEYLQAACEMGNGQSMLALATLLKDEGRREEGVQWLMLAEKQPSMGEQTAWARKYWETAREETPSFVADHPKAGSTMAGLNAGPHSYWTTFDAKMRLEAWYNTEEGRRRKAKTV